MSRLVAGFGCRQGCPVDALSAMLDQVLQANDLDRRQLVGIASLDRKADEPGLVQLAAQLRVPFYTFSAAELLVHEPQLSHRSDTSFAHTGCFGVAESTALALTEELGASHPQLLVTRQQTAEATLALACR
jgi:cobalt-precorrin 5A hydrolase